MELTYADLIAAGCTTSGPAPRAQQQTDAEAHAEHADPAANPFAVFGACECHACRRHRAATEAP